MTEEQMEASITAAWNKNDVNPILKLSTPYAYYIFSMGYKLAYKEIEAAKKLHVEENVKLIKLDDEFKDYHETDPEGKHWEAHLRYLERHDDEDRDYEQGMNED